jgi:3-oxoadipate enol-lactonase
MAASAPPLAHLRWRGGSGAPFHPLPLVVLLHGIGGGRLAWSDEFCGTGLALAGAGFDVIAPDLPGYGDSRPVDPLNMATMALAVVELVRWANAPQCIVVGHSMGGMVAQELIAIAPACVSGMVLSGTSSAFGKPDGAWQERFLQDRLRPLDEGRGMAVLAAQLVRGMCAPGTSDSALRLASDLMAGVPETTYRQALRGLMGFDRREQLPKIGVPVLVLAGELDPNAPPAVMQAMAARITQAEYCCLSGVGHLANIEAPERFNAAVISFLRKHFIHPSSI